MAKSGGKTCFDAGEIGFCHFTAVLQTKDTDLDPSLLYNLILGTCSKFARKFNRRLLSRRSKRVPQIASATEIGYVNRIFEISRRLIAPNLLPDTQPHLKHDYYVDCHYILICQEVPPLYLQRKYPPWTAAEGSVPRD